MMEMNWIAEWGVCVGNGLGGIALWDELDPALLCFEVYVMGEWIYLIVYLGELTGIEVDMVVL